MDAHEVRAGDLFSTVEVLKAVNGMPLIGAAQMSGIHFSSVAIDSRKVKEGGLFIALKGEVEDGHNYILEALNKGASTIFLRRDKMSYYNMFHSTYPDRAFVTVNDGLEALEDLASAYVAKFPKLVRIGITGSSGKTTTRSIVQAVLSQKYKVVGTQGNLNSITGLPLSIFSIRGEHEAGVFELGMNMVGEIARTAKVLKPSIGIITNIGQAHIGILGSKDNIAREKKHIFDYLGPDGIAILPNRDEYTGYLAKGVPGRRLYYGEGCNPRIKLVKDRGLGGTSFTVDGVSMTLPLVGRGAYMDALAAVTLALALGLTPSMIKAGIQSVCPEGARGKVLRGRYTIVEDCYNANPQSMAQALDFCAKVDYSGERYFVIADMLELGAGEEEAHLNVVRQALSLGITTYYIGARLAKACKQLGVKDLVYDNALDETMAIVARDILAKAPEGAMILLKGSHSMCLQRLVGLLESSRAES